MAEQSAVWQQELGIKTRGCKGCYRILPSTSFPKNNARCRDCKREDDRGRPRSNSRNKSRNWTEAAQLRRRRWIKANFDPVKYRARRAVHLAIKSGKLTVPEACMDCGKTPSPGRNGSRMIQAHHHNGYENALDVVWLCPVCHRKAHYDAAMAATPEKTNDAIDWDYCYCQGCGAAKGTPPHFCTSQCPVQLYPATPEQTNEN